MSVISTAPASGDRTGWFGQFGGRYVPETLVAALDELTGVYAAASDRCER